MDADKYTRSVELLCPTCGNSILQQAEGDESEEKMIQCPSCNRTMSRDELIRENSATIDAAMDEMKTEVLADVEKELKNMLTNAFKGSKNIRIK